MGIDDYVDTVAPAPDWLENSWRISQKNGNDKLTMRQIDAVIAQDRRAVAKNGPKASGSSKAPGK